MQAQATRALGNLALTSDEKLATQMVSEGVLELLVLLAASWAEAVQEEAAIALSNFAEWPRFRLRIIKAGAVTALLEQIKSTSPAVQYHGALALVALQ